LLEPTLDLAAIERHCHGPPLLSAHMTRVHRVHRQWTLMSPCPPRCSAPTHGYDSLYVSGEFRRLAKARRRDTVDCNS
jgi:hypothetical protein